jgi:hypothetical protein
MKAWKHILLLIGALGVSGVFAPMLEVKHRDVAIELSASELSFGFKDKHARLETGNARLDRELARRGLDRSQLEKYIPASVRSAQQDIRLVAEASRWAALAYAPAALLLLLGLVGILRRRFGRVLGALAVLCSLASIGAWLGLHLGIPIALEQSDLKHTQVALRFGAHLLLLAGIVGVLAGLGALIKPDLGRRPPRAAASPGSPPPGSPPGPPPGFPPPPMPPPALPPPAGR